MVDQVRKFDVFGAVQVECDDTATVVQVQVCDEQAQCRMYRLRMPEKMASDAGCGGARADAKEQAEVGARAGGHAFDDESTHEIERHTTGGVSKRTPVDSCALEHRPGLHSELTQ